MHFGRKKKLTLQQMDELRHRREQGVLIKTLMKDYRLSKANVYRYVSETDSSQSAKTTYPTYSTFSRDRAKIPNMPITIANTNPMAAAIRMI